MSDEEMNNDLEEEMEGEEEPMPEKEASEPEMSMGGDEGVTADDKLWALLAYAIPLVVPILIILLEDKKNRPFIRAHNAQALVWGIIVAIVSSLTSFLCGIPGFLLWLVGVYWGWQAYQGQEVTIPVITDLVKQQGWA